MATHASDSSVPSSGSNNVTITHFRLLDLPLEIQRMIYCHMFTLPSTDPVSPGISLRHSPSRASISVLRVLTVSHRMYKECLPLFYALNPLRLGTPTQLWYFLRALSVDRRQYIRELIIGGFGPSWRGSLVAPQAFSMLQLLPGLTDLELDLEVMDPEMGTYYEWTELLDILEKEGLEVVKREAYFEPDRWQLIDFDAFCSAVIALASLRGVRLGRVWGMPEELIETESPLELAAECYEVDGEWVKELRKIMGRDKAIRSSKWESRLKLKAKGHMVMGSGASRLQYLMMRHPHWIEPEGGKLHKEYFLWKRVPNKKGSNGEEYDTNNPSDDDNASRNSAEVRDQDGVNFDRRMITDDRALA